MFPLAIFAGKVATAVGVSKIVGDIVTNNVQVASTAQAVVVKAGSFVIASMAVEKSLEHIDQQVANIREMIDKSKTSEEPAK